LAGSGFAKVIEKNALADAVLGELRGRAEAAGHPTTAELAELRREQWERFDRPVSVATLHAVVLLKKAGDDRAAADLAQKIHEATEGLGKPEEFAKAARKVSAGGLEKRVESLPPVTPDGRTVQFDPAVPLSTKHLHPAFASAANAIANEGEVSPVVKTPFGYHVILLVERIDSQRYTDEELGKRFGNLVLRRRAKREMTSLMDALEEQASVERARNIDRLTAEVWGQH
jgi:parvulin-like peptidyl-prolyl isomerase